MLNIAYWRKGFKCNIFKKRQQAQRQIENHKQKMQQKDKEFAKLKEEKENLQKENERLKKRNLFQRIFNK